MKKTRTVLTIVGVLLLVFAALAGTFRRYRVVSASEAPTIVPGDYILTNASAYDLTLPFTRDRIARVSNPCAGDMIVYRLPRYAQGTTHIKRVVGVPGDRVEIRNNVLYVNDTPVAQDRLDPAAFRELGTDCRLGEAMALEHGPGPKHRISYTAEAGLPDEFGPFTVPPGHYFLLGDNRDNSRDSRQHGPVPRKDILGKVVAWPMRLR